MTSHGREIRVVCDCAAQITGGLAELVPVLAPDADLGAFRLTYAAGRPSAGALQAAGVWCTEHGSPLKVHGPLTHRHRRTIGPSRAYAY
jgi:hypothetical protein